MFLIQIQTEVDMSVIKICNKDNEKVQKLILDLTSAFFDLREKDEKYFEDNYEHLYKLIKVIKAASKLHHFRI